MLVVVLCVLIGLAGGWAGRRVMLLPGNSLLIDLMTGVLGATAAGMVVRMFRLGGTSLWVTLVAAAVGAIAVTLARSAGESSRGASMWRHP